MPVGLSIRSNRNRVSPLPKRVYPEDYGTPGRQAGGWGVSTAHESAWWPPVESQELVVQYLFGHHKNKSYIGTHQFPPSRCKLFNYYRLSNDNVHRVFAKVQYPWLSYYGDQQGYTIRSIMSGVSLFQGFKYTGVQEHMSSGVPNVW